MERKAVSEIMLTLLLVSLFTLPFNIQPVKAESGTIYIRADGAVDPPTANITSIDNVTYTFTGNINDSIVVERNNIVVNGVGYTVQGTGAVDSRGIDLPQVSNVTVKNTTIRNFWYGIYLNYTNEITLIGNNITANPWRGIVLSSSSNNNISGNNITANDVSIYLSSSSNNNIISGNNIANNYLGIRLLSSSNNNIISGNNIANNYLGIVLLSSSNNNISGNNITANDMDGIYLSYSSNNSISGNNIANNYLGIRLLSSSNNNIISGNNIANNYDDGIDLSSSSSNIISGNNITANNYDGICLSSSSSNSISGNNITASDYHGIRLSYSSNNSISGNNITANDMDGIYLSYSSNNSISGNNIANNLLGIVLSYSSNNISGNNITANDGYGILLSYSSNNSISGNNIANNFDGIFLSSSSNNNISGNNITANNHDGIWFSRSSNNIISGNNIANNDDGIGLGSSSNNSIYHNNFIDNAQQVYIFLLAGYSSNYWDNGYPSGGNYWSNYTGVDFYSGPSQDHVGSDGIGDTPYVIDTNNTDRYPFMNKFTKTYEQNVTIKIMGEEYPVLLISNSTLSQVVATSNTLNFTATGVEGASGYIWAVFPVSLNTTNIKVFLNGTKITPTISTNGTHYFIYFVFTFTSIYEITIVLAEARFTLTTLYTVNLYVNKTFDYGTNLKVKFYSYFDIQEGEVTVWNGTTPYHVTLSMNVSHPLNWPIENVTLVLTDDLGNILQTITTFLVRRSHLFSRIVEIVARWPFAPPAERITLFKELVDICKQWHYAPT